MLVSIYRDAGNGEYDGTNGGISSKYTRGVLAGPDTPPDKMFTDKMYEDSEPIPIFHLKERGGAIGAYPGDHESHWYMFGGNFIYSCDSRFPTGTPIKIMDRLER